MYEPIEDIEKAYEKPDPWGFQTNPSDAVRKERIIACSKYLLKEGEEQFESCLDIGCGEGWITKDLPAKVKYGYEISENAKSRWKKDILDIASPVVEVPLDLDLVLATGVMYSHYNTMNFWPMLKLAQIGAITCNIKTWEIPGLQSYVEKLGFKQIYEEEFPYRDYVQKLRVLKKI